MGYELGTDKAFLAIPFYIEINGEQPQQIIGVYAAVVSKMLYDTVVFAFLFRSYRYTVYLTGDESEFAESALSYSLLVEGGRQWETAVSAAEAVHF